MLDVAHLFPGAAGQVYLNTASMALGNAPGAAALAQATSEWLDGGFDWTAAEKTGEELRSLAARLMGAPVASIALTAGAAGGAATVAHQLPSAPPGGNVVVPARDFMSNFVAWALLRNRGYEIRTVRDDGGRITVDDFAEAVDGTTAVIATSLVQSVSGFRVDVDGLKQLAAESGAWLVFDASQAFGAMTLDLDGVAALFSCSHKWSLGVRGIGYLYVAPALLENFTPVLPGWKAVADPMHNFYGPDFELVDSAARLDVSWPWFNPLADLAGLRILDQVGLAKVEAHNRELVEALAAAGCALSFEPSERSAIVSLAVADTDATLREMNGQRIVASLRGGRLRLSIHLYNTLADIDAVVAVVGVT